MPVTFSCKGWIRTFLLTDSVFLDLGIAMSNAGSRRGSPPWIEGVFAGEWRNAGS